MALDDLDQRLLASIYNAWRHDAPIDRERALFSLVRAGLSPNEAADVFKRVVTRDQPQLVRDDGKLTPTLAGALALVDSSHHTNALAELDNLRELVGLLNKEYEPGRRPISIADIARELGHSAEQIVFAAKLADLNRTVDSLELQPEALFWTSFEAFLDRRVRWKSRWRENTPRLPITTSVRQLRWAELGPFRKTAVLDLSAMTVLVGANGAGKTTALAALATASAIATKGLPGAHEHHGRLPRDAEHLTLGVVAELTRPGDDAHETIEWELVAGHRGRLHARREHARTDDRVLVELDRGTGQWRGPAGELLPCSIRPDELALNKASSPTTDAALIALRQSLQQWHVELAATERHRSLVALGDISPAEAEWQQLWLAYARDSRAFEQLREQVRAVTRIRDLELRDPRGSLMVEDAGGTRVDASLASSGVVRVIELLAWLCAPDPPTLLAIDEIENHLHGDLAARLVDVMRSAAHRTQIVVTTHSARVLRCFASSEVRLVRRDENTSAIVSVDHDPRLRRLAKAGDLAQLIEGGYFAGGL